MAAASADIPLIALIDEHGQAPASEDQAMWQRFLTNPPSIAPPRPHQFFREAILIFGGNGIVEDSRAARLLAACADRRNLGGCAQHVCLQIMRDARRSRLLDRWLAAVQTASEGWPRDFLAGTNRRFTSALAEMQRVLSSEQITDRSWGETHARRIVDRLGALLEIAWMAELAVRQASSGDATAALLTRVACDELCRQKGLSVVVYGRLANTRFTH